MSEQRPLNYDDMVRMLGQQEVRHQIQVSALESVISGLRRKLDEYEKDENPEKPQKSTKNADNGRTDARP
jgi:hypothetical protein